MGYFLTLLVNLAQNSLMGVGIHSVFSVGGVFFLGFPSVVNISVYVLSIAEREGVAPSLAFLLAMLAALLVSALFAALHAKMSEDSFVVLGLSSILACQALTLSWSEVTNGVLGIKGILRPELMKTLPALTVGALIFAFAFLLFESVLLASWAGRAFRAAKEDRHAVEAMGISSQRLSIFLVLFSGMLVSMGAVFVIWQVQFLDPHYADLAFMVEVLTMGILALKPKVRSLALAVLFVVLVPEILRFFHLPSDVLGHLRTLLYARALS